MDVFNARLRSDVLQHLPHATSVQAFCPLPEEQRTVYVFCFHVFGQDPCGHFIKEDRPLFASFPVNDTLSAVQIHVLGIHSAKF